MCEGVQEEVLECREGAVRELVGVGCWVSHAEEGVFGEGSCWWCCWLVWRWRWRDGDGAEDEDKGEGASV